MYQQNIPCASQVSTSALVGSGVSGLGAFRTPTGPPTVTSVVSATTCSSRARYPLPICLLPVGVWDAGATGSVTV
jgi:hypothetical protein